MIVERRGGRRQLRDVTEVRLEEVVTFNELSVTLVAYPLQAVREAGAVFGIILGMAKLPPTDSTMVFSPALFHKLQILLGLRQRKIE
jgi:hypothetical protein